VANHGPWCDCPACEADRLPPQGTLRTENRVTDQAPGYGWSLAMRSEIDRLRGKPAMLVELRGETPDDIKREFANLLEQLGWE